MQRTHCEELLSIKKDEMGETYSTHGSKFDYVTASGSQNISYTFIVVL
jgi:hypothetical protein